MADARPTERLVHQTVHGYRQGHQLLAASVDLDHDTANILGHNSDSAPRSRASDGSYLTGYPLPDDKYVIARTWSDDEAERPNTVITRSLILPRARPADYDGSEILSHLKPPTSTERNSETLAPLDLEALCGDSLALESDEAIEASRFYRTMDRLTHVSAEARGRIAIALWQQLWMPARHNMFFCTAPDTTRFARSERPLLFTNEPNEVSPIATTHRLVVRDLEAPGPFREFLHFVGSGEKSIGLIEPFAEAYELLNDPEPRVDALPLLLDRYRGTEPRRLRRLKRRFLSFQGAAPRWAVDRFDLLVSLGQSGLGNAVYASDASLDRWLRYCWDSDPSHTALLLSSMSAPDNALPVGPATAAEGISDAFASQASDLITADTLSIAVALSPSAAGAAVWDRNQGELWHAWCKLEPESEVPSGEVRTDTYDWLIPLHAARHHARSISRLLRRYPEALDHLIALADERPAPSDSSLELTGDAKRYIRGRLEGPDLHLTGLSRLSDHGVLPKHLAVPVWRQLLPQSKDEAVQATAYLIARAAPTDHWEIAAIAIASLYSTLDGPGGEDAWRRLNPHIRGDQHSWDRCGRLLDDYADQLRRLDDTVKSEALKVLDERNPSAASSLAKKLRTAKSKKFSLFDPSTW